MKYIEFKECFDRYNILENILIEQAKKLFLMQGEKNLSKYSDWKVEKANEDYALVTCEWYCCGDTEYETVEVYWKFLEMTDEAIKQELEEKERTRVEKAQKERDERNRLNQEKQKEERKKSYERLKKEFE